MSKSTKRVKPTTSYTLDADIAQWIREEAARRRVTASWLINEWGHEKRAQQQKEEQMREEK